MNKNQQHTVIENKKNLYSTLLRYEIFEYILKLHFMYSIQYHNHSV